MLDEHDCTRRPCAMIRPFRLPSGLFGHCPDCLDLGSWSEICSANDWGEALVGATA